MAIDTKFFKVGTDKIFKVGSDVAGIVPPPIPLTISNCILFLDNNPAFITMSGSNKVSEWRDRSGNSNDFIQGTGSNQPTFVANGINGQNGIRWSNSTNEFLDCTFNGTYSQIYDIITVWNIDVNSTQLYPYAYDRALTGDRVQLYWFSNNIRVGTTVISAAYAKTRPFNLIATHVSYNGASTTVYQNNTLQGTVNTGAGVLSTLRLGHTSTIDSLSRLSGFICEVLIYNKQLSSLERTTINDYLTAKYGL
jgi:hypothetical protein